MWPARLEKWRREVEAAAAQTGVAPELIAAVMDRESLGGLALTPQGAAGTGDYGHGRGIMQIDDRSHIDFTSSEDWKDPTLNILYGASILMRNLRMFGGDVPPAVAAYNAGTVRVGRLMAMVPAASIEQLDLLTTGKDYVSDVLGRLHKLQFDMPATSPPEDGSS